MKSLKAFNNGRQAFAERLNYVLHELHSGFIGKVSVSQTISGRVIEVDSTGNLITDILADQLGAAPRDESLRVVVDEHETFGLYASQHDQPEMTLIAIVDQTGPLKIALVGDSASAMLGVRVGAPVQVLW